MSNPKKPKITFKLVTNCWDICLNKLLTQSVATLRPNITKTICTEIKVDSHEYIWSYDRTQIHYSADM